ncbi:DegT/DnrJ/EryC1/StrS family aminotransferase [Pelagibacteraceae bacterium]|jgi:CDP-4-dehydro-6-deoxyglucose reductase, E1|nr:DegT/DnrJ/EryC1/StrS family aminotransferase [Pelagibacteraceae bacterium]MDC0529939.1 DegT/DnrJ/EryC1/StrS family aminotransferase [Pelagibacteraceae bacterium]
MKNNELKFLIKLIDKYSKASNKKFYSLTGDPFIKEDIIAGIKTLLNGQITMSSITKKFEKKFARYVGSKYALMVNSGSSANLLAFFSSINPKNKNKLKKDDECLIPAICWSTSLWPIVQAGLKPVFVDVDLNNFNFDIKKLEKKITTKTRAIMAVHVLGNSTNMSMLMKIANKYKLTLIEDTCESLGSKYNNKYLGTFGKFGTYSFYVSHQLIAGEGGMLVCNDYNDYKIAHTLRAHGWDRGLKKNSKFDFNFINSGFNLRPLDLTAAIGLNQLKRLKRSNDIRTYNRNKIINSLLSSSKWKNQFTFFEPEKNLKPSWFGLPILLNKKFLKNKKSFLNKLNKNGVETRPIISGNFLNQPSINLYKLNERREKFPAAQEIEDRGFFIGLHTKNIEKKEVIKLTNNLLNIN